MDIVSINSFKPTSNYNRFEFSSVESNGSGKGFIALNVLDLKSPDDIYITSDYFLATNYLKNALSENSIISA